MFQLIGTKVVDLTPELAHEYATMQAVPGERPLRKSRLKFLGRKCQDGMFHSPKWAVAFLGGKKFRVNGQHSSTMLSQANGYFPKGLKAVIDEFRCEQDADLSELFSQFDAAQSARSTTEICNAHASIHSEIAHLAPRTIRNCAFGIASAMMYSGDTGRTDSENVARLVHDESDFILWASGFIGKKDLNRMGIIGAMYSTYKIDPNAANTFWTFVRDETHPDRENPTRVLAKFFTVVEAARGSMKETAAPSDKRACYSKSIHAWNAFRQSRTTSLRYHTKSPIPKAA